MPKLTKGFVDRLRPSAKDQLIWDTEVRGFGVRLTPTGKISFIVQGRIVGGPPGTSPGRGPLRITIGPYGVFTVEQARDEAREHLRSMRKGIDPRAVKKADAALRVTLDEVATAYVARPGKLKQSSKDAIERHVRTTFEDWRYDPIANITEAMCKARYRKILTSGLRGDRPNGSPGQASQGFAILGALLAYAGRQFKRADGTPLCSRAPVDGIKDDRVPLKPRTTRIHDHKVGECWIALREWRATAYQRDTLSSVDLVRFLLLTGLRISEAAGLTWDRVNLDDAWFSLLNPKNGNAVMFPLSTQSVELLKGRSSRKGFVFPSSWGKAGHITDPRDVMLKVSEINGSHLSPHSLRRTFTNISLRCCRIEHFRTSLLTNHISQDVTSVHYFDTSNLIWLRPEAQAIADWIETQASIASGGNVVRMATAAGAA